MRNNQADSRDAEAPFNDFDMDMNATHLIKDVQLHQRTALVEKLDVKPGEQRRVALGSFTEDNPAKGFSIELNPDPAPAGSVITEVSALGISHQYKLVMHIANYGTKTVSAEVRQL